jgi:hypothetical protein
MEPGKLPNSVGFAQKPSLNGFAEGDLEEQK